MIYDWHEMTILRRLLVSKKVNQLTWITRDDMTLIILIICLSFLQIYWYALKLPDRKKDVEREESNI